MARRSPPRKVTYVEPVPPRLARNTIIEFDLQGRSPLPPVIQKYQYVTGNIAAIPSPIPFL